MKKLGKRILALSLSLMVSASVFLAAGVQSFAYTETTGTVSTDNVKVRSSASTTASQVSSLTNGDKVDIVDEATDSSGYTWYKIRVNKSEFGYVRSDLVTKAGGTSSSTTTSNTTQSNAAAASLPATTATATEQRTANITEDSVNVREGAGTAYNSVGKVKKGDTVTVTGEATGTDNKTWYQVTFGNGKQGYIRSDLLQLGDVVAAEGEGAEGGEVSEAEGEGSEGQEEGSSESEDGAAVTSEAGDGNFSLVYLPDEEGNGVWYLYDNIEGYRVKVRELIDAAKSSDEVNKLVKRSNNYKTILVILAVVIAALVIGLIIMALKLRDSLYYEDEEEEEYDRYAQPRRRARQDDEDEQEQHPRTARPATAESRTVRPVKNEEERPVRPARPVRREEEDAAQPQRPRRAAADYGEERPVRKTPEERAVRPQRRAEAEDDRAQRKPAYRDPQEAPRPREEARRKPKNFIGDDDDFEFEFLDLDEDK